MADDYQHKLWDLERKVIVEAHETGESTFDEWFRQKPIGIDVAQNHFEATEYISSVPSLALWNRWIGERIPAAAFKSPWRIVRDSVTMSVRYRCEEPTIVGLVRPNGFNSNGAVISSKGLVVDHDGGVRPLDPTPRWGLIAILQGILAAPLVTVWALLSWRRWRRAMAPDA
jgi:hypothetical protein